MTFMDKLKSKADELDLQGKADRLADAATKAAQQTREKAGELADENRDKVERVLDKAGAAIDERTEGKYAINAKCRRRPPTLRSETSDASGLTEFYRQLLRFRYHQGDEAQRLWGNRIGTGRTGWS